MENQLTITDKSAISQMPQQLQKYALAKEGEIVAKMSVKFAIKSIYEIIAKTLVDTGVRNIQDQEQVIVNIADSVYKLICDKYKTLTINELKLVCFNGALEEYGKYFGINLKTVSDWLKGYLNDENKKKAMAEWNRLIDLVQIKKYSDEQKEFIVLDGCVNFFEEYKQAGILKQILVPADSLAAVFYDTLKEIKLLIFTKERKLQIYDEAEILYKKKLAESRDNRKIKFEQKDMDYMLEMIANNSNKSFANLCKRLSLYKYFDDLIEMDQDMASLILETSTNTIFNEKYKAKSV